MGSEDLLKLLVYFFTTGGIPILQIENPYFIRFVEVLVSLAPGCNFQLPKRTKFMAEIMKELDLVKKQVKQNIYVSTTYYHPYYVFAVIYKLTTCYLVNAWQGFIRFRLLGIYQQSSLHDGYQPLYRQGLEPTTATCFL